MPRLGRDALELKTRAINSLVLAIELFNRPHGKARPEGVLILLHHSFEMLLKATIRHRKLSVHTKDDKYTYSFRQCLEMAQNELKVISADERTALSILDAHRDAAMHYYQELSEDLLYVQAQASVTLFNDLLLSAFGERLADQIPERVLPISTKPPRDLQLLLDHELSQVDTLLQAGSRRGVQASARLRPLLSMATAVRTDSERVSEAELRKAISKRREGVEWIAILPELAQLRLDTEGGGIPVSFRIKNDADLAVRIAKDGEPVEGSLLKQEVNILDKFTLSRDDLAKKIGISGPKTLALIYELGIQDDSECFRIFRIRRSEFKRYSLKALQCLRTAIEQVDVADVWQKHKHKLGAGRHHSGR